MVKAIEGFSMEVDKGEKIYVITDFDMQTVYPQAEEGLIDFLECCKLYDSKIMLCPRCSVVFYEEAVKKLENTERYDPRRGREGSQVARFASNNKGGPHRNEEYMRQLRHSH